MNDARRVAWHSLCNLGEDNTKRKLGTETRRKEKMTCVNCNISKTRTVCSFLKNGTCSKTLMTVIDRKLGHPMRLEERATDPLAGGLMQGYQCGMLWGSTLAAGAEMYRQYGAGPQAEAAAMSAAEKLVDSFRAQNEHINCLEITETDPRDGWKVFVHFFLKGGTFSCMRRAAKFAPEACGTINAALSEDHSDAPCQPASCAAELARRMGASEMHAVMAAGLAGGIGLRGGACGALGSAIWLTGINSAKEGVSKKETQSRIEETIERFLKASDYEIECSEIVGRRFDDRSDHADHVHSGGCANIIDALAATSADTELPSPTLQPPTYENTTPPQLGTASGHVQHGESARL